MAVNSSFMCRIRMTFPCAYSDQRRGRRLAKPLGVMILGAVQLRQVVEAVGDVGVVGSERLLAAVDRPAGTRSDATVVMFSQ